MNFSILQQIGLGGSSLLVQKHLPLSYQLLVLICHIIKLYLVMLAMEDAIR
ncbi:hypothetical protein BvCmsOUNP041_02906 [Escherichia coli]|nr:hypothetical protein BvCmsOUNP041_02906 [Escherichia coli]